MSANNDEQDSLRRPRKGVAMNLEYIGVPTNEYDNGRDEKPWQRVVSQMTRKGKHLYEPVKSLPSTFLLLLLAGFLLLGYLTQLVEDDMPAVVQDADVARDVHNTFSEGAAWGYLRDILGSEPRVSGTIYHYNKTRDMKAIVDNIAVHANQPVLTDWQNVTGNYYLQSAAPFLNLYQNASNVIAVLEGESGFHSNGTIGSSILVNCHYDSVPFAMGASDNAVFCAVMAEILSRLSRRTRMFKHNIVFLFNGAEENGLQASHAFLKHRWAAGVRSVVNLDAAGMNGKPAVFQVTDPRVLHAFKRSVYRPNAQGLGEFLFSSGIIPSDTDFRIFRDFGGINGIDIAFSKWGHVYHTRNDRVDLLQPGVIQNAGNMLMGLVSDLADMEELDTKVEPSTAVYFDYLNVFMVTYSIPASYAVDTAVLVVTVLSIGYYVWLVGPRMSTVTELLYALLSRFVCVAAGIVLTALCACIMIPTTIQLRYMSEPWLVVPIFWMPYLIGCVAASQAFDAWRTKKSGLNRSIRTLQAMAATRLALALTLAVLMCIPALVTARYVVGAPLFIISLMSFVSLTAIRYIRLQAWKHLWLEIALALPSVMFTLTFALRINAMILPIMGRSPGGSPDVTVGFINVGVALLVSSTVSGIELLVSRRRLWLPLAAVGAASFVLMFIPFAPYRPEGPVMRHYWFHSEIVTFDQNKVPTETTTGVVVYKLDVNTIPHVIRDLAAGGVRLEGAPSQHCAQRVYCDLPLYRTSYARFLPEALLLSTSGPRAFSPPADVAVTRTCAGEVCMCRFVVTGSTHNTITIWPYPNVNLTSWSFDSPVTVDFHLLDRPVYVIVHSLATYSGVMAPLEFSANFIVPLSLQSQPIMQVSLHAHKIHHSEDFTEGYRRILNAAPDYYNIASFLSFRHNYVF